MNDVVHDDSTGRDFHVGGQDRNLSEAEQLEQLSWYINEHHPMPTASADKDAWLARLPDRLTHAAMLMLGAAVDHTMPGVAFTQGVEVQELPELAAVMFIPQQPNDRQRWAVSLSPGLSAFALDNAWRPEVAAGPVPQDRDQLGVLEASPLHPLPQQLVGDVPGGFVETLQAGPEHADDDLVEVFRDGAGAFDLAGTGRGGVVGAIATMGVIMGTSSPVFIGEDGSGSPMFLGAMICGPLAAWCMKKLDGLWAGKVRPGFEMLMLWPERLHRDPAHQWLRSLVSERFRNGPSE